MIQTTEGIVLKTLTFRESDQIVTLLTPRMGKVAGLARYGKKSLKRFGSVLQPFNILEFQFRERPHSSLILLEKAAIKIPLFHIYRDIYSIVGSCYCLELMDELVHERDPNFEKYLLLLNILQKINNHSLPLPFLLRWYEFRLLTLAGIGPEFRHCIKCHAAIEDDCDYQFVYWEGGVLCPPCYVSGKMSDVLRGHDVLEFMAFMDSFDQGSPREIEKHTAVQFRKILHNFIHYHLNKILKSQIFMESLRSGISCESPAFA
ncbi:MAG: DNA repair protein RecO [Deltaproteobacteria bacterium RIFCSPLOWO2_02_FULL_50_16]|nr:MAG: DNA repair protein RecO [Deltaproteobacteria bacterium RIFCSPLOWO2_02_FULL_50_16]OGQ65786.1 MAG: DNA repair protein RecO [Deltaproteobacteria bacterium RIFCSPLOWO2_12_FULL_50_11]